MNDPNDWMSSYFAGAGKSPSLKTYHWPYIILAKINHNQASLHHGTFCKWYVWVDGTLLLMVRFADGTFLWMVSFF